MSVKSTWTVWDEARKMEGLSLLQCSSHSRSMTGVSSLLPFINQQTPLMMKNMPDTFSVDSACLQTFPCETLILYNTVTGIIFQIGNHAQLKHFPKGSRKHTRFNID